MNEEKYGFVYKWYDKKHDRYYIGSHWGTIDDGYICSSNWMYNSHKRRPEDFNREILEKIYTNRHDTYKSEKKWLSCIKIEELGKKYYNRGNKVACFEEAWNKGIPRTEEQNEKFSNMMKEKYANGLEPWNKGKSGIYSEETKQKISKSLIGNKRHSGHKATEELKKKLS